MNHNATPGYDPTDQHYHPSCPCGWTTTATRWASAALAAINIHLALVGDNDKKIPTQRETWARRYLGAGR